MAVCSTFSKKPAAGGARWEERTASDDWQKSIEERLERIEQRLHRIERLLVAGERERLTGKQAARLLGVSYSRVLQPLIARGVVKTIRKGSRMAVPRSDVERLARDGVPDPNLAARRRRTRRASGAKAPAANAPMTAADYAKQLIAERRNDDRRASTAPPRD